MLSLLLITTRFDDNFLRIILGGKKLFLELLCGGLVSPMPPSLFLD